MSFRSWWVAGMVAAAIGLVGPAGPADAQVTQTEPDFPRGRISGYLFGDYYYNMDGLEGHAYNSSGSDSGKAYIDGATSANGTPNNITRDLNGIAIRRIYFQADNDLSVKYSTRFRLEADGKALTSDGKISVNVKAAYLLAKNVVPRGNFLVGMLTTPIWENSEEFWAYRSIEKTIGDFRGIGSSADLGVQLKGFADGDHRIGYSAMFGNGIGQKPEDNRYKKGYLSLPLRPTEDFRLEPYVDYEAAPNNVERITYKIFAGYDTRRGALGVEVLDRVNHQGASPTKEPFGFSIFGRSKLRSNLSAFARWDRWQADSRLANRIDSDLYIGGFDWEPYKDVHFMPNVEANQYHARGTALAPPTNDLQARLTVYYKWSKP
jgi:hypothetical protein